MTIRRILASCVVAGLLAASAIAQDGKLLASVPVAADDAALASVAQTRPEVRSLPAHIQVSSITYSSDGLRVRGYLAIPLQGQGLPCVIFNRGGNREYGAMDDRTAVARLGKIASWGYIVVASQYRGNAGGEGREEFGGADVDDVLNLIPLLESLPRADARRIGMLGWSRGGMMTYLALARTDRIAAAIVGGGMSDLGAGLARRPDMEAVYADLIPGYAESREAVLAARSPIHWVDRLPARTPLLLLHGTGDWRVDPTETMAMASRLLELKRPFRLVLFEGGDHGLSEHADEVDRLTRSWLDRYVRDRQPWPSLEPHGP